MNKKLIFALVTLPVIFGAFKVTDRVAFDRGQWIADFEQLKQEIEANYANLKWARPSKDVDFVELNKTTLAALESAQTRSQARAALATFIHGFNDEHFHIQSGPPRPVAALMSLLPEDRLPAIDFAMPTAKVCATLGYGRSQHLLELEHAGLTVNKNAEFASGVIDVGEGRKFGVIRIPLFQQRDYGTSCERAWDAFRATRTGPCDEACQDEFYHAAKMEVSAQLAREAIALTKTAPNGLIIDLTGNGGGTEWADYAAAALTSKKLNRPGVAFVRGEHWTRAFAEDIESFEAEGHAADLTIAKAMQDSARAKCDVSGVWTNQAFEPSCWNVVTQTPYPTETALDELKQPVPYDGKLFILVDENTASASELFAAVLQDNGVAVVIGTPTMGVGCGYTNGGIDIKLRNSGLAIVMPDCARLRADGSNEYEGIKADIAADWGETPASKGAALAKALTSQVSGRTGRI